MRSSLRNTSVITAALILAGPTLIGAEATPAAKDVSPLEWSIRMAESEIARSEKKVNPSLGGRAKWDYTLGLFTLSLIKLAEQVDTPRYIRFSDQVIGSLIDPSGQITGYKVSEYNIDHLNAGKTVLALYGHTGEDRYRKAAQLLRSQLDQHPRTSEGGFWHKQRYPHQMWLDGLYMGAPFYAEYALRFDQPGAFDDVVKQFRLIDEHLYDTKSGLYYHGWDEAKAQSWANKTTGLSPNFWSRGLGWYGMALVDALDYLPLNHPGRPQLIAILGKWAAGVEKHQDAKTGLWYQVTDQGDRAGNYFEATASSMFVYTVAKGINRGYLPEHYKTVAEKGYQGILRDLISVDASGAVNLNQCCQVAGLSADRDGSFEYYIREPIISNDFKGVGPFILAGIEMDRLLHPPGWGQLPRILSQIQAPTFPDRDFSIADYGAKPGGEFDCGSAIAAAIDACAKAGGGRVVVPAGVWLTGAIHLKSNVNLHVSEGATLKFSTDYKRYLPVVQTRFEGMDCLNYSPFIYAYGQENIAITGKGTLDGQGDYANWWGWARKFEGDTSTPVQKPDRDRLYKQMDAGAPLAERVYGENHYLRTNFIQPYRCRNVLIEGITIVRSPMWEIHPLLCVNVTVRGVTIHTHGPNNDGCNPESSRNVLIENCTFDTGDDCIAIKSGRNNDGRRWLMASENIVVRGCTMKDGHGGTVIGSEVSGSCRNVFTENCVMDSPELERALRLKTNAVRGGTIENIFMRNVQVGRVKYEILTVDFSYEEGENGQHYPLVQNIALEHVTSRTTPRVFSLVGYKKSPIRTVRLSHCSFNDVHGEDVVQHVEGLECQDVKIDRK